MNILKLITDILFPKRCAYCGEVIGFLPSCKECDECLPKLTRVFDEPVNNICEELKFVDKAYVMYDYTSVIRSAILQMKFYKKPEKANIFGSIIAQKIKACNIINTFDIIVAVPSTKNAIKKRGYDIPLIIATQISEQLQKPLVMHTLIKDFETKKQSSLTGSQRRGNLAGAFLVKTPQAIKCKRILLIDDVITTGTTINECAKVLLYAGAESISSACIAISSDKQVTNRK